MVLVLGVSNLRRPEAVQQSRPFHVGQFISFTELINRNCQRQMQLSLSQIWKKICSLPVLSFSVPSVIGLVLYHFWECWIWIFPVPSLISFRIAGFVYHCLVFALFWTLPVLSFSVPGFIGFVLYHFWECWICVFPIPSFITFRIAGFVFHCLGFDG